MKPLPKGKPLARCIECKGEAVAQGDGRPVTIAHAPDCSELLRLATELCETCGGPVKMMSQHMSGYCSPRCEQTGDTTSQTATRVAD